MMTGEQCECCGASEAEFEDRHGRLWCDYCHDYCEVDWACAKSRAEAYVRPLDSSGNLSPQSPSPVQSPYPALKVPQSPTQPR